MYVRRHYHVARLDECLRVRYALASYVRTSAGRPCRMVGWSVGRSVGRSVGHTGIYVRATAERATGQQVAFTLIQNSWQDRIIEERRELARRIKKYDAISLF